MKRKKIVALATTAVSIFVSLAGITSIMAYASGGADNTLAGTVTATSTEDGTNTPDDGTKTPDKEDIESGENGSGNDGDSTVTPGDDGDTPGEDGDNDATITPGDDGNTPGDDGNTPGEDGDNDATTTPGDSTVTPGDDGNTPGDNEDEDNGATTTPGQPSDNEGNEDNKDVVDVESEVIIENNSSIVKVEDLSTGKVNTVTISKEEAKDKLVVTLEDIATLSTGKGSVDVKVEGRAKVNIPFGSISAAILSEAKSIDLIIDQALKADTILKNFNIKGVNKEFNLDLVAKLKNGGSKYIHDFVDGYKVKVSIEFTDEELKGLDMSKLNFFYYNEASKKLEKMPTKWDGRVATFETTHFSKFLLLEATDSTIGTTAKTTTTKTGDVAGNKVIQVGLVLLASAALVGGIVVYSKKSKAVTK